MATVTLVASFAAAVYLNGMLLIPRFAHRQSWFAYLAFLLGTVAALDLIAVLLIQTIYDHFWRPDPLRYGFWTNMAMDGFGIAVHVLAAMLLIGIMKRIRH